LISIIKFKDITVRFKLLSIIFILLMLVLIFSRFVVVDFNKIIEAAEKHRFSIVSDKAQEFEHLLSSKIKPVWHLANLINTNSEFRNTDKIKSVLNDYIGSDTSLLMYADANQVYASKLGWQKYNQAKVDIKSGRLSSVLESSNINYHQSGAWTDVYFDDWLDEFVVSYYLPVFNNDIVVGVVALIVNIDSLLKPIVQNETSGNIDFFVFSSSGDMLSHPDYGAKQLRKSASQGGITNMDEILRAPLVKFISDWNSGIRHTYFSEWNEKFQLSAMPIENTSWTIVAYQAESDILEPFYAEYLQFGLFVLLFLTVASLYFQWSIVQLLSNPLKKLSEGIKLYLRDGQLLDDLAVREDEIGLVAESSIAELNRIQNQLGLHKTEIKELKSKNSEQQALTQAVSQSDYAVLLLNDQLDVIYVDAKTLNLLGDDREHLMTVNFPNLVNDQMGFVVEQLNNELRRKGSWRGELILTQRNTEHEVWVDCSISPIRNENGNVEKFAVSLLDISFIKDSQNKIEKLAYTDELTGLSNRSFFIAQLEKLVEISKRGRYAFGLLYFDLDDFKKVNDLFGHEGGDKLLQEFAFRISKELRTEDVLARIGGDEFAMIVGGVKSEQDVILKVNQIINAANESFVVEDQAIQSGVSIGITMSTTDVADPEKLLQHADLAMYEAKALGKNTYHFYTQELNDNTRYRLNMENALAKAIPLNEFELYFQPKVHSKQKKLIGFEALLRWQSESLGFVSPADFIPIAEQSGIILKIGSWVIDQAALFVSTLSEQKRVSINISARQFEAGMVAYDLMNAIKKYQVDPSTLEVEITESSLMVDVEDAIRQLHSIKKLGVNISIDDFGTGYSSLSYLKRFPVETLKIDRSFIKDIPDDKNDMEITAAIIAMAQKLGMEVIAEGAETQEQIDFLADNDCFLIQGYFFSKPLPAEEAKNWSLP
jgi:diguanylate cyclase (GGDEF)-like protein/PAS domain S-box-containing protein